MSMKLVAAVSVVLSVLGTALCNAQDDWAKEDGVRLYSAISTCTILHDNMYYMYYTGGGGISLARSSDGLNFDDYGRVVEDGATDDPDEGAHDPTIVSYNGTLRMFYSGERRDYEGHERYIVICSAVSTDGLNWVKEGELLTPDDTDDGQMSVPDAIILPNGELWIYYTFGFDRQNSIRAAVYDGPTLNQADLYNIDNWRRQDLVGFEDNSMDPDLIKVLDDPLLLRLFFAKPSKTVPMPGEPNIYSATSSDGINWNIEGGVRVAVTKTEEGEGVGDPDVIDIGDNRYRMYYYGMKDNETSDVLSVLSPMLDIEVSQLTAGERFTIDLNMHGGITTPFDFYNFAALGNSYYTIYLNGRLERGIKKIYSNVQQLTNTSLSMSIAPAARIPATAAGSTATFYTVVTDAGRIPPVGGDPSVLTPQTQYVILMDQEERQVQ